MGDFHGYDTSDDYFIKAVWPLASRELRRLSKTRGFGMRGPGRVLRGKEVVKWATWVRAIIGRPRVAPA